MATLPFVKVEGLGNDFLVVDLRPGKPAHPLADVVTNPETVRALCDRNFGVGGDGVLAILPSSQGDARMRVLNADGSEAEMCGNGIRCVAKVLHDQDPTLRREILRIDTGAGLLDCKIDTQNQRAMSVTVEMGVPQLLPRRIPVASDAPRLVRAPLRAKDHDFAFTPVSMWVEVTVTLGITAPVESLTTPWSVALPELWAMAHEVTRIAEAIAFRTTR